MTPLKLFILSVITIIVVGAAVFESSKAASLRKQYNTLEQKQKLLSSELGQLKTNKETLTKQLIQLNKTNQPSVQLLKLRNIAGQEQAASQEIQVLKTNELLRTTAMSNAMEQGLVFARNYQKREVLNRLARMKETLQLTDDQEQSIKKIMMEDTESRIQKTQNAMMGITNASDKVLNPNEVEAQIKSVLTSEQLASYDKFKETEVDHLNQQVAENSSVTIAKEFNLSREQKEQLKNQLYEAEKVSPTPPIDTTHMDLADKYSVNENAKLESRLKVLQNFLTPDQLTSYKQEETENIKTHTDRIKVALSAGKPNK